MTREEVLENLSVLAWNHEGDECRTLLSAIELLSPVAPERRDIYHIMSNWYWRCGNCGHPLDRDTMDFCPGCGRKVKWYG